MLLFRSVFPIYHGLIFASFMVSVGAHACVGACLCRVPAVPVVPLPLFRLTLTTLCDVQLCTVIGSDLFKYLLEQVRLGVLCVVCCSVEVSIPCRFSFVIVTVCCDKQKYSVERFTMYMFVSAAAFLTLAGISHVCM